MADGYQVDLAALRAAADGIRRTVDRAGEHPVAPLATAPGATGHARLAASLAGFGERWQAGVRHLVADGRAAGEHLTRAAGAYAVAEGAARAGFEEPVRRAGPTR